MATCSKSGVPQRGNYVDHNARSEYVVQSYSWWCVWRFFACPQRMPRLWTHWGWVSWEQPAKPGLPGSWKLKCCMCVVGKIKRWCLQDFPSFSEYMHQFSRSQYMAALSDFHLLIYLATCDMLPLKVRRDDSHTCHSYCISDDLLLQTYVYVFSRHFYLCQVNGVNGGDIVFIQCVSVCVSVCSGPSIRPV